MQYKEMRERAYNRKYGLLSIYIFFSEQMNGLFHFLSFTFFECYNNYRLNTA